jgi:hypothetical protein
LISELKLERAKRLEEAIALVQVQRQDDGRWLLQNRYPGEPSRWNTPRAPRVLR